MVFILGANLNIPVECGNYPMLFLYTICELIMYNLVNMLKR